MNAKHETLAQKARKHITRSKPRLRVDDELIELVYLWASNELAIAQVVHALGKKQAAHVYAPMCEVLQHMILEGLLEPSAELRAILKPEGGTR